MSEKPSTDIRSGENMNSGNSNPLSNIGTPSFSLSQVPQHILQSLTPAQLQMIQQKHQQLLMQRQRQVQQMQQEQVTSPQNLNQLDAAQRAQLMNLKQQQMQRSQMQQQSQSTQNAQQQQQQQPQQKPADMQQRSGAAPSSLNLPPQIAQLSPQLQMQWIQSIKQQAIARNNQNALMMINQLEIKLRQEHQRQGQQGTLVGNQQPSTTTGAPTMTSNMSPVSTTSQQGMTQQQMPIVPSAPNPPQHSPPSHAAIQAQLLAQFQQQLPEIPKFQTILQDPSEAVLPNPTYWSEKEIKENGKPKFETKLYEHLIQRDSLNMNAFITDTKGHEPLSSSGLSQREVLQRLQKDLNYYEEVKNSRMQSITNTTQGRKSKSIWGDGYLGYGNGLTNDITRIQIDDSNQVQIDKVYDWALNETKETLVPIRLEFDAEKDKFTLRDTFVWNKEDTLLSVEDYVSTIIKDYRLPNTPEIFQQLHHSIKEQIQDFTPDPFNEESRYGGDDLRIKISLDIVVGQHQLVDTIEWDISNPNNDPEGFAQSLCEELALPGEFMTAIVHAIREQVHMYHKSLSLCGYKFDGSVVEDDEIRSRLLPVITLEDVLRSVKDTPIYTPNLLQISHVELERLVKDKDRDTRRKRRQGRFNRRGNNDNHQSSSAPANVSQEIDLPDLSDIPKTYRQTIPTTVLPGGIDLGPDTRSFHTSTRVEYIDRPKPEPKLEQPSPACRIITHDPGHSLLLSLRLRKK